MRELAVVAFLTLDGVMLDCTPTTTGVLLLTYEPA
jgi:hypothetical protein